MPRSNVDIFQFLDYRTYLRAFYDAEKAAAPTFSFRAFSMRAGVASPNHLKRIMDGERSLKGELVERYAKVLGLGPSERRYFEALVSFTDAADSRQREEAYRVLRSFRQYQEAHQLDERHAAYHESWYIPAIRELAGRHDFRDDPRWVARQLRPRIRVKEARDALVTLEELGLLQRVDGALTKVDAVLTTGAQTRGAHITRYHRVMLECASQAIDEFPASERDLSALTCCVDEATLPVLRAMIADFRRQCVAVAEQSRRPARVVQLNIQLFPLSETAEGATE
ncbi:MAG: TIGR02147 family protein [Polyangiales bacterium]|nr:TIGR02147 family protein [Myxococcales bacterium]MCB9660344.1 TIGR02147 family protein [Sandaracinaceae bacterium]